MESLNKNKLQFVIEKLIYIISTLLLMGIIAFYMDRLNEIVVNVTLALVALMIAASILFAFLKSRGKWFKSTEHVPRKYNVMFVIVCNFIIWFILQEWLHSYFAFVPAIVYFVIECINYHFNFKEVEE